VSQARLLGFHLSHKVPSQAQNGENWTKISLEDFQVLHQNNELIFKRNIGEGYEKAPLTTVFETPVQNEAHDLLGGDSDTDGGVGEGDSRDFSFEQAKILQFEI